MNPILAFFQSNIGKKLGNGSSPLAKWLDGTLESVTEGSLSASFTVREDMCNPGRILHGGIAVAIMDDLMGMTVASMGYEFFFTSINLSTDFLYSVPMGGQIVCTTQIIRAGKKVVNIEANIKDSQGRLIAKTTSNLVATSQSFKPKTNE